MLNHPHIIFILFIECVHDTHVYVCEYRCAYAMVYVWKLENNFCLLPSLTVSSGDGTQVFERGFYVASCFLLFFSSLLLGFGGTKMLLRLSRASGWALVSQWVSAGPRGQEMLLDEICDGEDCKRLCSFLWEDWAVRSVS